MKTSGLNPCDLGKSILDEFVPNYPFQTDITQSVVDLSKMQAVSDALEAFGVSLLNHTNNQPILLRDARVQVRNYAYTDNKDLYSYAEIIRANASYADLQTAAANLETALLSANSAVIYNGHGVSQTGSNGMAIYVPAKVDYLVAYNRLALTHSAPHWAQFLQSQTL